MYSIGFPGFPRVSLTLFFEEWNSDVPLTKGWISMDSNVVTCFVSVLQTLAKPDQKPPEILPQLPLICSPLSLSSDVEVVPCTAPIEHQATSCALAAAPIPNGRSPS